MVVTGGSRGIGRAISLELAAAGADVLVHYGHALKPAEEVAEAIRCQGRTAWIIGGDFSNPQAQHDFVEHAWNTCGKIDAWVHNAGADLLTGDASQWSYDQKLIALLSVDVQSTMVICKEVARRMHAAGQGTILTIGWDQADRGMEGDSGELFAAAKNAIMGFTRSLAVSYAPQVRVNCIAPGWIRTAWGEQAGPIWQERVIRETPLGRWGEPQDIANLARFLLSREASYLTGQVINANGGAVR
ncbi:SDR family oxidoreductase [bacterium]|nr:SDR family oxidoreductase [bacterium]